MMSQKLFNRIERTLQIREGVQIFVMPFQKCNAYVFKVEDEKFIAISGKTNKRRREKLIEWGLLLHRNNVSAGVQPQFAIS